jgi:hypothetical protein
MGRPGYAPKDLLKLYIYGYLNRVRSSRRLEAETHRNIEVIWLQPHDSPHFHSAPKVSANNWTSASMAAKWLISGISRWSGMVGMRS